MNNSILIQDKHDDPQTVKLSITENREWKGNNSVHFKTVISNIDNLPTLLKTTNFSLNHWQDKESRAGEEYSQYRKGDNWESASGIMIDYDGTLTIDGAKQRLKQSGLKYILVSSKSHSPELHKFHVLIFYERIITDKNQHRKITQYYHKKYFSDSDPSVKDLARFFMGSPDDCVVEMDTQGQHIDTNGILSLIDFQLVSDLKIELASGKTVLLNEIKEKSPCKCPHPDHDDNNPSAFIDLHEDGNHYCHCSSCDWTWREQDDENYWYKKCKNFWSYGKDVYEFGIIGGDFFMEKITQKKFNILTDSNLDQDSKNRSLNHLVKNKHIPHLVRVDYIGDVDIEAPSYEVNKNKGVVQVRYDALPVKLKDSEFVASFIHDRFGQYAQFFKEWLALYVYTNYRKLPTIILAGPRGRGKSTIAEMAAEIYPSLSQEWHGHEQTHNYEVEKKFLYVEENEMSNSHQYKTLKKYSGQKYAMVNKKYKVPYKVRNNTSIMMLTNDKVPIYVKRDELPTDSKNNQFFVYELPPIKTGINTDIQSALVNRLGHYIRTELKQVYEGLNMDGYRYSIDVPITPEEKLLFQCSTTDLEADADKYIEKLILSKNDAYRPFFIKGYVPVQFFKDFDISANHYNRVIKNLVKRGQLMGNYERIMVKNERHYCYKMTDKLRDEIDKAIFKQL